MTTLSFCIPTRNFGPFIGTTLDHLLRQRGPNDEIVIVDGNSTDQTVEVVRAYQRQHPRIRFEQQRNNGGVDRDLAYAVSLARGDYCWLFSADDGLVDGAVDTVRQVLSSQPDALLMERIDCDFRLQPQRARRWLATGRRLSLYELADESSLEAYFGAVRSLGGMFSYISSLVVRRAAWEDMAPDESLWGTHYTHVGRLFMLLRQHGSRLAVLSEPLVLCRGDNDSFAQQGRVRRFMIDVDGYLRIGELVFGQRPDLRARFNKAFRVDHGMAALCGIRMRVEREEDWTLLVRKLRLLGFGPLRPWLASWIGRIHPLVMLVRALRNQSLRLAARMLDGRLRGARTQRKENGA